MCAAGAITRAAAAAAPLPAHRVSSFQHANAARTKQYFHLLLHRRLDEILAVASPRRRVVLALDGPAPLAKLLEQRCVGWCCAGAACLPAIAKEFARGWSVPGVAWLPP